MLALRSARPLPGVAEAVDAARDLYGLTVVSPLPGERDSNFLARDATGRDYVLKFVDAAAEPLAAECLVQGLRHLAEQAPELPVPRAHRTLSGSSTGVWLQDGAEQHTCLLDYLPGELLSTRRIEQSLLGDLGATLGRIDRGLRGFFHPGLARRMAWDVRNLPALVEFSPFIELPDVRRNVEKVIDRIRALLPVLRGLRSQALHGDCHAGNVLVGAVDRIGGVLDFGDMLHAPLIVEPAVAMSELLTGTLVEPADLSALLGGYVRLRSLAAADIAVLYDLVTARHATTVILHAWRTRHDPAGSGVLSQQATVAAASLESLLSAGGETLTGEWQRVAGTGAAPSAAFDLGRRQRALGAGAELFYDRPLHLVRGEGVWLYDPAGHAHLDAYNNVPHVGHCHPAVVRAVQTQVARLSTHTRYWHERVLEYAERLLAQCPAHLDACIFVNSGSEANDVAWRMAQFVTGRRGAVIMQHAYHGITDAVAALTPGAGQPTDERVVALSVPAENWTVADAVTPAALAAATDDADGAMGVLAARGLRPAAFFVDTALTSSGIYDPPAAWLDAVTRPLRAAGAVLVADEVQYGLGRSGTHFWGFERRGLVPDMVTLGKPIGNGYPMGAVIANRATIEAFQAKFGFFSTFGGTAVAAAAGLAVLDVIENERLMQHAADSGAYLRGRLVDLSARHGCFGAVRGCGLLLGLEVCGSDTHDAGRRTRRLVNTLASRARVLIGSEGPAGDILKIRPPMPFGREHADLLVDALAAAAVDLEAVT